MKSSTLLRMLSLSGTAIVFFLSSGVAGQATQYTVDLEGPVTLSAMLPAHGTFRLTPPNGPAIVVHNTPLLTINVQNLQSAFPPTFASLNPLLPLPATFNFGNSRKNINCTFNYNGAVYAWQGTDTFTIPYPHQARWDFPADGVDYDAHETAAILLLTVQLEDNSVHEVFRYPKSISHTSGALGATLIGRHCYDGLKVLLKQGRNQTWTEPRSQTQYNWFAHSSDEDIPTHKGSAVVYVQPIPIPGQPAVQDDSEYEGDYDYRGDLLPHWKDRTLDSGLLLYSDGMSLYLPYVTQELWEKNNWRVGFGIVSYKTNFQAQLNSRALITGAPMLPQGIYHKRGSNFVGAQRQERWEKLGGPNILPAVSYLIDVPHNDPTVTAEGGFTVFDATEKLQYFSFTSLLTHITLEPTLLTTQPFATNFYNTLSKWVNLKEIDMGGSSFAEIAILNQLISHFATRSSQPLIKANVKTDGLHDIQQLRTTLNNYAPLQIIKLAVSGGDTEVQHLIGFLPRMCHLTHLNLYAPTLGQSSLQSIGNFLAQNPPIQVINIRLNNMPKVAVNWNSLTNTNLTHLYLTVMQGGLDVSEWVINYNKAEVNINAH